jgi:hypothetical protein
VPEKKKKGEIIYQISMVGFQCVAKNIEGWLQKSGASKHKKIITQFCRLNGGGLQVQIQHIPRSLKMGLIIGFKLLYVCFTTIYFFQNVLMNTFSLEEVELNK